MRRAERWTGCEMMEAMTLYLNTSLQFKTPFSKIVGLVFSQSDLSNLNFEVLFVFFFHLFAKWWHNYTSIVWLNPWLVHIIRHEINGLDFAQSSLFCSKIKLLIYQPTINNTKECTLWLDNIKLNEIILREKEKKRRNRSKKSKKNP